MLSSIINSILDLSKSNPALSLILLSILPVTELRASIPYGILAMQISWPEVFLICVLANIVVGVIIFLFIEEIIALLNHLPPIARLYHKYVEINRHKAQYYIDKYGEIGLAIFIGIPLPGSGVYTGAIIANVIGLKFKKFLIADILGVLAAGFIVTLITLTGNEIFSFLIKTI